MLTRQTKKRKLSLFSACKFEKVQINVIILGEYGVGKTCILNYMIEHQSQLVTRFKNKLIAFNFIDTLGQEKYDHSISFNLMKNIDIVVLVYTNATT